MKTLALVAFLWILALPQSAFASIFGFVYDSGKFTTIDVPGVQSNTWATGINNNGYVVGFFGSSLYQGYSYAPTYSTLNGPGATETTPMGINASGEVVGTFYNGGLSHGFSYTGGILTQIDVPGTIGSTSVNGINDSGQIVGAYGNQGFLYQSGVFTTINVPGALGTSLAGINNNGDIVGNYSLAGDAPGACHSFLYKSGAFTTISVPGASCTSAHGINNSEQIIGDYQNGPLEQGFLYDGVTFTTINNPGNGYGSTFTDLTGINDSGQIVGVFAQDSPEPATIVLFLSGTVVFIIRRMRLS